MPLRNPKRIWRLLTPDNRMIVISVERSMDIVTMKPTSTARIGESLEPGSTRTWSGEDMEDLEGATEAEALTKAIGVMIEHLTQSFPPCPTCDGSGLNPGEGRCPRCYGTGEDRGEGVEPYQIGTTV